MISEEHQLMGGVKSRRAYYRLSARGFILCCVVVGCGRTAPRVMTTQPSSATTIASAATSADGGAVAADPARAVDAPLRRRTGWQLVDIAANVPFKKIWSSAESAGVLAVQRLAISQEARESFRVEGCGLAAAGTLYCWFQIFGSKLKAEAQRAQGCANTTALNLNSGCAQLANGKPGTFVAGDLPFTCTPTTDVCRVKKPPCTTSAGGAVRCDDYQDPEDEKFTKSIRGADSMYPLGRGGSCFLARGELYCRGMGATTFWMPSNSNGPFRDQKPIGLRATPDLHNFKAVYPLDRDFCALRTSGELHCWISSSEEGRLFVLPLGPQNAISLVQDTGNIATMRDGTLLLQDGSVRQLVETETPDANLRAAREAAGIIGLTAEVVPGTASDFIDVSAYCGLRKNGAVQCWMPKFD
jgi:hypothetical protein